MKEALEHLELVISLIEDNKVMNENVKKLVLEHLHLSYYQIKRQLSFL